MLDQLESLLDRVKVLYEQYFLGIQKQAPAHLHHDLDRKLRDLSQIQIRNTAMRYRLATVQQKFGSYNTYWRRTLRQIENGTYARNLSRIGRQSVRTGEEIPEEILAAMPKRMREQVARDREAALAQQRRRPPASAAASSGLTGEGGVGADFDLDIEEAALDDVATIHSKPPPMHQLEEEDDVDVDALFAAITDTGAPASVESKPPSKRAGTDVGFGESSGTKPRPRAPQPVRPAAAQASAVMMPGPATAGTMISAGTTVVAGAVGSGAMPVQAQAQPPVMPAPVVQAPAPPVVQAPAPSSPSMGESIARITPKKIATQPMTAVRPGRPPAAEPPKPTTQPMGSAHPAVEPPAPAPAAMLSSSTPALPKAPTTQPMRSPPPPRPVAGRPAPPPPTSPSRQPTERRPVQAPPAAASSLPSSPRPAGAPVAPVAPPRVRPPSGVPPLASHAPRVADPLKPVAPPAAAAPPRPPPIPSIPRPPIPPAPRAAAPAAAAAAAAGRPLPPGVSQADVSALYDQYVKARSSVGEQSDARTYDRLVRTIEQQAPKIMQEHQAKGVEFQVVVKDNQVVVKAKPKP